MNVWRDIVILCAPRVCGTYQRLLHASAGCRLCEQSPKHTESREYISNSTKRSVFGEDGAEKLREVTDF